MIFVSEPTSAASDQTDNFENRSISELISTLRCTFLTVDFDKVEEILIAREAKLKKEIDKKIKECALLRKKNELERLDRRKVGAELEIWKRKFEDSRTRILKLEERIGGFMKGGFVVSNEMENDSGGSRAVTQEAIKEKGNTGDENVEIENDAARMNNRTLPDHLQNEVNLIDIDGKDQMGRGERSNSHAPAIQSAVADNSKVPFGSAVEIADSDSDDDGSAPADTLQTNKMSSQNLEDHLPAGQESVENRTGMLKRKGNLHSCTSDDKNDDGHDDDFILVNKLSCKKPRELITDPAVSSSSTKKLITPSTQTALTLRQCKEKVGVGTISGDFITKLFLEGMDDLSEDSSSSSDSDDDLIFHQLKLVEEKNRGDRNWEFEADMLAAFDKDVELVMKAVCALYRQQNSVTKPLNALSFSNKRGFNKFDALRGTALGEFLTDGDPQARLKKSITDLEKFDTNGVSDCKRIAINHSEQLFEIYQKKEDQILFS